jgi:hypothetical protein
MRMIKVALVIPRKEVVEDEAGRGVVEEITEGILVGGREIGAVVELIITEEEGVAEDELTAEEIIIGVEEVTVVKVMVKEMEGLVNIEGEDVEMDVDGLVEDSTSTQGKMEKIPSRREIHPVNRKGATLITLKSNRS